MKYEIGKCYLWEGGECPLPDGSRVDAFLRSGEGSGQLAAKYAKWDHEDKGYDIVAFIPRHIPEPPREKFRGWVWVNDDGDVAHVYVEETDPPAEPKPEPATPPIEVWANVYAGRGPFLYNSREDADASVGPGRIRCVRLIEAPE